MEENKNKDKTKQNKDKHPASLAALIEFIFGLSTKKISTNKYANIKRWNQFDENVKYAAGIKYEHSIEAGQNMLNIEFSLHSTMYLKLFWKYLHLTFLLKSLKTVNCSPSSLPQIPMQYQAMEAMNMFRSEKDDTRKFGGETCEETTNCLTSCWNLTTKPHFSRI